MVGHRDQFFKLKNIFLAVCLFSSTPLPTLDKLQFVLKTKFSFRLDRKRKLNIVNAEGANSLEIFLMGQTQTLFLFIGVIFSTRLQI